jgi:calmodulin
LLNFAPLDKERKISLSMIDGFLKNSFDINNPIKKKSAKKKMTEKEERMRDAFNLYDRKGEGRIQTSDLGSVIRCCGNNPSQQQIKDLIEDFDPESTGFIDVNTFKTIMKKNVGSSNVKEDIKEAFKIFDKENSGYISVVELRHVLTTLGERLSNSDVDDFLKNAHIEKDGTINFDTFMKILLPQELKSN